MLVELPFASFFLSKLLGTSADVDIHHLASLDPEMYRNLLFLKSYEDDVEDLGLNFTIVNNDLGEAQVGGACVCVCVDGGDVGVITASPSLIACDSIPLSCLCLWPCHSVPLAIPFSLPAVLIINFPHVVCIWH